MFEALYPFYAATYKEYTLLISIVCAFIAKIILIITLSKHAVRVKPLLTSWALLLAVLIGSLAGDIAWIIKLVRILFVPEIPYTALVAAIRISYGMLVLQYQSLATFIQSLDQKKSIFNLARKVSMVLSILLACYFFWATFFESRLTDPVTRSAATSSSTIISWDTPLEIIFMKVAVYYIFIMVAPCLYALSLLKKSEPPKLLKLQINILIKGLVFPYLVIDILQACIVTFVNLKAHIYPLVSTSTILLTIAIYYSLQKILRLRFLNHSNVVDDKTHKKLAQTLAFNRLLHTLNAASSVHDLQKIVTRAFSEALEVKRDFCTFVNRDVTLLDNQRIDTIEELISNDTYKTSDIFKAHKILILDDLELSLFYNDTEMFKNACSFLREINADIFVPILQQDRLVAYIIVNYNSRPQKPYTLRERNEITILSTYVSTAINLIKALDVTSATLEETALEQELLAKKQLLGHYKESVKTLMTAENTKNIGIIVYQQRAFRLVNDAAHALIKTNLNTHAGTPLARAIKELVQRVERYHQPATAELHDQDHNILLAYAVYNDQQHAVIITMQRPSVYEWLTDHTHLATDSSMWDHLLHLKTTQSGHLISQLIPGDAPELISGKLALLRAANHRESVYIASPASDQEAIALLIHHIAGGNRYEQWTPAMSLFGTETANQRTVVSGLLEQMNEQDTLYIDRIEQIDHTTQRHLARYIIHSAHTTFPTEKFPTSRARIIIAHELELHTLFVSNVVCEELYHALEPNILSLPTPSSLSEKVLLELIQGYAQQAIANNELKHILELNKRDIAELYAEKHVSLSTLRERVHAIIREKGEELAIQENYYTRMTQNTSDLFSQARGLGKQALKDPKIMRKLWRTLKNQHKIAEFLGVHRSSVSRRCKDYGIV